MFFRFLCALALVVAISLVGTALEKRNLALNRAVSRQHYQLEILLKRHSRERMLAQQLGAPANLVDRVERAVAKPPQPVQSTQPEDAKRYGGH